MNDRLKLFIPLIIFVALATLFYAVLKNEDYDPQDLPSALIGQNVPHFELPELVTDKRIRHEDLLGQIYLLNVWATWCISCRVEHPYLNQLKEQGVAVVGLNYKDDKTKAREWLENLGNPYQSVIFDEQGKLGLDLGVYGAPETYLVDSSGVIRYKHVGVIDDKVWQEKIRPHYEKLKP